MRDSNFSVFRVRRFSEWPEPLHWIVFPVENPFQTPHSLNCLPPFHWKPLFFTEKCFVASPSQKWALIIAAWQAHAECAARIGPADLADTSPSLPNSPGESHWVTAGRPSWFSRLSAWNPWSQSGAQDKLWQNRTFWSCDILYRERGDRVLVIQRIRGDTIWGNRTESLREESLPPRPRGSPRGPPKTSKNLWEVAFVTWSSKEEGRGTRNGYEASKRSKGTSGL